MKHHEKIIKTLEVFFYLTLLFANLLFLIKTHEHLMNSTVVFQLLVLMALVILLAKENTESAAWFLVGIFLYVGYVILEYVKSHH